MVVESRGQSVKLAPWERSAGRARILVSLTQPYAEMVGPSLAKLPAADRSRLRILGFGLKPCLPREFLHQQLITYDDRLNQVIPGTRLDGASRARPFLRGWWPRAR